MEPDKEFIKQKVAQFRARQGQPADNVAEPAEEPPTPSNTPDSSGSNGRDGSSSSSDADEQANEIRRILANVVELKCSAKAKK